MTRIEICMCAFYPVWVYFSLGVNVILYVSPRPVHVQKLWNAETEKSSDHGCVYKFVIRPRDERYTWASTLWESKQDSDPKVGCTRWAGYTYILTYTRSFFYSTSEADSPVTILQNWKVCEEAQQWLGRKGKATVENQVCESQKSTPRLDLWLLLFHLTARDSTHTQVDSVWAYSVQMFETGRGVYSHLPSQLKSLRLAGRFKNTIS